MKMVGDERFSVFFSRKDTKMLFKMVGDDFFLEPWKKVLARVASEGS